MIFPRSLATAIRARLALLVSLVSVTIVSIGAAAAASIPLVGLSEDEARAEFASLCESLKHGDNGFFSDRAAVELEAALPTVAGDPIKEASVLGLLGKEKLKLGDPKRATELLRSRRWRRSPGAKRRRRREWCRRSSGSRRWRGWATPRIRTASRTTARAAACCR